MSPSVTPISPQWGEAERLYLAPHGGSGVRVSGG
jgi:hypothetical protein